MHLYVYTLSPSVSLGICLSIYLPPYHLCIYPYLQKNNNMARKLLPYRIGTFQKSCKVNWPRKKALSSLRHLKVGSVCQCTSNKQCREFTPHLLCPPLFPPSADRMPATLVYNCSLRVSGTLPLGLCSDHSHYLECFPLRYSILSPPSSLFKFHFE